MGKILTFEIQDEIYAALEKKAARTGQSVETLALEWLARHRQEPPPLTEEESRAAHERLRRFAGCVNSGDPRSGDNERIDADLARAYAQTLDAEE